MRSPFKAGRRRRCALARTVGVTIAGLHQLLLASLAFADDSGGLLQLAQTLPAADLPTAQPATPDLKPGAALEIDVIARALDEARGQIQPSLGATVYQLQRQTIENQPQGYDAPLNQVLLQAPGVAQDSFGQVHVRGDHANLQYRINGIQLPEGITGFGQVLSPRFANSISLLTGALPAQFGLRTAGVVDIKTKDGLLDNLADVEFYGGQRNTEQPSFEVGGSKGK